MLPVLVLLLLGFAQVQQGGLFVWAIDDLGSVQRQIVVTITPTPFAVVNGFDPKTITLDLVPTSYDPKPPTISPQKTEPAPESGLRATFTRPPRRFTLTVTLADGSTEKVDPWAPRPTGPEMKEIRPMTHSYIRTWAD
jgi:hypothetical protein